VIRKVVIRRFKKFQEVTFDLPGHIVLAGPNNTGKTTLLQAIASWSLALDFWRRLNDFNKRNGYTSAPVTRQLFAAVPVRSFELLWHARQYFGRTIEVEVHGDGGWHIGMQLSADSTEQIYVRPTNDTDSHVLRTQATRAVYIPPMGGLGTDEPVLQPPKISQLLGMGKVGDVIRNLLVEAHRDQARWEALRGSIHAMFGYDMLPPDASGPDILAEYRPVEGGPSFDIASAGSGFQQVLMLSAFLHARPGSILLIDEPDAHLHVLLQDVIYGELKRVALRESSQLIIATHSEVIINSVEPRELCAVLTTPRLLADTEDRNKLLLSLRALSNQDIVLAHASPGVLYTEGYSDLNLLKEWAHVLNHPIADWLSGGVFWKPTRWEAEPGRPGASSLDSSKHFEALRLVRDDLPGLELLDRDDNPHLPETEITGVGLQRLRWKRYEIESYLFHPKALARFVEQTVGTQAQPSVAALEEYLADNLPPPMLREPLGEHDYLNATKARDSIIGKSLQAAGIHNMPHTRYNEIASLMKPEEIHPEVREKLDAIQKAFSL
jgi:predicted ATPase